MMETGSEPIIFDEPTLPDNDIALEAETLSVAPEFAPQKNPTSGSSQPAQQNSPTPTSSIENDHRYKEMVDNYEKQIYDLQQLLEVSRSLCSTLEFSTLIESILYTCMGQMRVLSAGIFVLDALDADEFVLDTNYNGLELSPTISYKIPIDHPIVNLLSTRSEIFTVEELQKALPENCDIKMITSLNPSMVVPLVQKGHLNGLLLLGERIELGFGGGGESSGLSEYDKGQIMSIASLSSIAINNAALMERSSTDMMTHLKLKYFFFNVLTNKLDTALAQNNPVTVLMFDIDFFKKFNDTYGHACGDYVLITVAKILKSAIRAQDLASRYGGEEFTCLLNDTEKDDAMTVADRIRKKIEQYDFCYDGQHVQVTISVGVAIFDAEKNPVTSPKILVDQADQALYVSKRNGRNQVTFADEKIISEVKLDN